MTATPAKALRIDRLNKAYRMARGGVAPAVRDFTLHVAPGEFVTLLGPSGCGKTTVLRTLAGLEELDSGDISLDGRSITRLPSHQRRIGLVFQNYALFPHMSVFDNVAYSLRLRRTPAEAMRREVDAALKVVGLEDYGSRLPGQLSGGQQQRVAVARALVMKPDLLLFDEPLSNLDAKLRVQVRAELRRLQRNLGTTAVYVTHDRDEAMSLSDRIAVMRAGRVEQIGRPSEIYSRPSTLFVAEFVGKVNALPAQAISDDNGVATIAMLGGQIRAPSQQLPARDMLLLVRPEAMKIEAAAAAGLNGVVEEIEYLGDRTEYHIRADGALVVVVQPTSGFGNRIVEGDKVGLSFPEEAIHLLPLEGNRSQ